MCNNIINLILQLYLGPVELAAVGVSIAIFNQASRITIFPLVSITTSFVAEEDTVGKISMEASKAEKINDKCSPKSTEMKELITEDVTADKLERGATTSVAGTKESMQETGILTSPFLNIYIFI